MTPRFKLQPVLDYRRWREDLALRQLTVASTREAELLERLTREQEMLEAVYGNFEAMQKAGMPPHEIALYHDHIRHQIRALESLAKEWESARREVAERRQTLCERSRDAKLLEKVREKQQARSAEEERRRENATLDEIALQQYLR